ncbi:MAG: hypothetical protein M1816_004516 [Peltula sp. TS41687]|nr:MAG: hypothetical protein M1816_004516 [Peltula sp. TS41687]
MVDDSKDNNSTSEFGSSISTRITSSSPAKPRSLSDTPPMLSPSPKILESAKTSKDDITVMPSPATTTPRPSLFTRGLSLQMPREDKPRPNALNPLKPVPLSPQLDMSHIYGSPTSVLPRRSRGMDFSRACTNLHHSTLAEQSSPDSSPTLSGRATMIPNRRGFHNPWITQGSPSNLSLSHSHAHPHSHWSTTNNMDRIGMATSVGGISMLELDSNGSSSNDEDELMETDDPILTTPHVQTSFREGAFTKPTGTSPYVSSTSPGGDWMGQYSPAARSLMSFRRARTGKRNGRKESSSASASGSSSMPSPSPASPAATKGIENHQGYFAKDWSSNDKQSRRGSLTIGTKELQLSSGGESDEGGMAKRISNDPNKVSTSSGAMEEKRGVIKRAVTRRGNLLPKTKTFARIRAALMEEGAPIESEVRREAEVVRQVRESESEFYPNHHQSTRAPANTASPTMFPTTSGLPDPMDNMSEDDILTDRPTQSHNFNIQAKRLSGGREFWDNFDSRNRTPPPPPSFFPRAGSLAISDDVNMDSPITATPPVSTPSQQYTLHQEPSGKSSRSSGSVAAAGIGGASQPSAEEMTQKIRKKRARDDDFDPMSFKRRAVSPGMSVQNSPVLAESPIQKDGGWWGLPISNYHREMSTGSNNGGGGGGGARGHAGGERTNSVASSASGSVKRVGFQGMVDTNDGLQKMSIE